MIIELPRLVRRQTRAPKAWLKGFCSLTLGEITNTNKCRSGYTAAMGVDAVERRKNEFHEFQENSEKKPINHYFSQNSL